MMKSMVKMDEKQKQEMNQLNTKMDRLESTMETILNVIKKDWWSELSLIDEAYSFLKIKNLQLNLLLFKVNSFIKLQLL